MKQDVSAASTSDKQEKPAKSMKPQKNLYEPYRPPWICWHLLRAVVLLVITLTARVRFHGRENVSAKGPFIIAANHLSWTDIPLIPLPIGRRVVYMAKEEYFKSKWAWLVRFLGAFPVKRGEADRQALRAGEKQLKEGRILVMFPEGTRSRTRTLAAAHPGMGMIALRTGVPVVPVAIAGSQNLLKKFGARVTVTYGEPMIFKPKGSKMTREDIDNVTEQVMQKIASMLPPEYRGLYADKVQ